MKVDGGRAPFLSSACSFQTGSHYVPHVGLELTIFLPPPHKFCDYETTQFFFSFSELGAGSRASLVLCKYLLTELYPQAF